MTHTELKAWRLSQHLTQPDAANLLGYSLRQYQNMEDGTAEIRNAIKLACKQISLQNKQTDEYEDPF